MDTKKGLNFFYIIIAVLTGSRVFKDFDFQNFKFKKPVLDIIYLITFVASIIFIRKDYKKSPDK
jgi:hypothetical protein